MEQKQPVEITTCNTFKLILISIAILLLGVLTKCTPANASINDSTNQSLDSVISMQDTIITNIKKEVLKGQSVNESLIKELQENKKEIDRLQKQIKLLKQQGNTTKLIPRSAKVSNYIEKYKCYAIEAQRKYGIPVSITLAQAIIESNCGTSNLSINKNNHFGIKKGKAYRYYSSPEESFLHHAELLFKRYKVNTLNYSAWAYNLQKKGYAENPQYASILITTIQKYKLDQIA